MSGEIEGKFSCRVDGEKLCVTVETTDGVTYTMTIHDFEENEMLNDFVKTVFSR